jgi:hypothetical protein
MKNEVFKKYNIDFPWKIELSREAKEEYESMDEHIRRYEEDEKAIQKEKISNNFLVNLKKIFKEDKNLFLFVHHSQFMFCPVFCILFDITTPEQFSFTKETALVISKKFKESNFENELDKKCFLSLLYSARNQRRLKRVGIRIQKIDVYYY